MDIHEVHQKRKQVEDNSINREGKEQQQMATSTSPSQEFSFSVSVQKSDKTKSSTTVDLSPADDIFFDGHLLPLHLIPHLPPAAPAPCAAPLPNPNKQTQPNSKSLFNLRQLKRKLRFNLRHVVKRYARMVRPFLQFRLRRDDDDMQQHQQQVHNRRECYSFSGNLSFRKIKSELRGIRRGGFSAPVSMSTSQTNSGILLPTSTTNNDSTMEELQAAIQAAIAHCKNSILDVK